MKCIKCGKEIDNKSTACEYCGMLFTPVMKRKMLESTDRKDRGTD